jgi:hypothetical protein
LRQATFVLLASLLVLISGYAGYRVIFGVDGAPRLVVREASGQVQRDDGDGMPRTANVGDVLEDRDRLKVGADGHAVLSVGDRTELRLSSASTVRVLEVRNGGVRLELEEGRVHAVVRPGAPLVGISSRGRAALTSDGDLDAAVQSDGTFAVSASRGAVELQGMGELTGIQPGQRAVSVPGEKPALSAVSERLLLDVAWPSSSGEGLAGAPGGGPSRPMSGRTEPFARLVVHGGGGAEVEARADAEGRFVVTLPEAAAQGALVVEARDPLGREAQATRPAPVTPPPPSTPPPLPLPPVSTEVVWGGRAP